MTVNSQKNQERWLYYPSLKWFLGILRLFLLMNRLSCSFLWSTQCVWNQYIVWDTHCGFQKIKGWFNSVLIRSICFWERRPWEKTVMSALSSAALAARGNSMWGGLFYAATHSSVHLPCPFPGLRREPSFAGQPAEEGRTSNMEMKLFFF